MNASTDDAEFLTAADLTVFQRRLRRWFRREARALPWRENRDPYRVWLSEIMLQQTQVATVQGYFARFLAAFPTIADLAAAPEGDVMKLWEGLGYYRRARQLHKAAKIIAAEYAGSFPKEAEAIRRLPGIGRYTAGAILSIAFDRPEPILEANTIRLLCRLTGYRGDPQSSAGQRRLWQVAAALPPRRSPGEFNQALMELGSLVCTPQEPRCSACPVALFCTARKQGLQQVIPPPKRKAAVEQVRQAAVAIRNGQRVLLLSRAPGERWAGLWDFPRVTLDGENAAHHTRSIVAGIHNELGVSVIIGERLTTMRHTVTRFRIELDCYAAEYRGGEPRRAAGEIRWFELTELDGLALNTTGRRLANFLKNRGPSAKTGRSRTGGSSTSPRCH